MSKKLTERNFYLNLQEFDQRASVVKPLDGGCEERRSIQDHEFLPHQVGPEPERRQRVGDDDLLEHRVGNDVVLRPFR